MIILIDDDWLIRTIWENQAKKNNISFSSFESSKLFFEQANNFEKDSIVYIDSDLKESRKGEEIAKEIFDLGFQEIHLTTGHEASSFDKMEWIKSIVDKNPPW